MFRRSVGIVIIIVLVLCLCMEKIVAIDIHF